MAKKRHRELSDAEFNALADGGLPPSRAPAGPAGEPEPDAARALDAAERRRKLMDLIEECSGVLEYIAHRGGMTLSIAKQRIKAAGLIDFRKSKTRPEVEVVLELLEKHGSVRDVAAFLHYSESGLRGRLRELKLPPDTIAKYNKKLKRFDREAAIKALQKWRGNVRRAAAEMGVSYFFLYERIPREGLEEYVVKAGRYRPFFDSATGRAISPGEEPEAILGALDASGWDWDAAAARLGSRAQRLRDRVAALNLREIAKARYAAWKAKNPDRLRKFFEQINQPLSSFVASRGPDDDDF